LFFISVFLLHIWICCLLLLLMVITFLRISVYYGCVMVKIMTSWSSVSVNCTRLTRFHCREMLDILAKNVDYNLCCRTHFFQLLMFSWKFLISNFINWNCTGLLQVECILFLFIFDMTELPHIRINAVIVASDLTVMIICNYEVIFDWLLARMVKLLPLFF